MLYDSTFLIMDADRELTQAETSAQRVQEIFEEWWDNKEGEDSVKGDYIVFPVKLVDGVGFAGQPVARYGELHFPKDKLSEAQIKQLENSRV